MVETGSKNALKDIKRAGSVVFDIAENANQRKLSKTEYEKARLEAAVRGSAGSKELEIMEKKYKIQKRAQLLGFLKNSIGLKK